MQFRLWLRRVRSALGTHRRRWHARCIVRSLERARSSPLRTPAPTGYQRGIDFYSRRHLIDTLAKVLSEYRIASGRYPDLVSPRLFSEKLNHAKFFVPIKVPESGNKLLTASFLPPDLHDRVRVPAIVWQGDAPRLPGNDALAPGLYYLKANHGSSMVRRIRYPLAEGERRELEATCAQWLTTPYGLDKGEWWYDTFPRRVLIEEAVVAQSPSLALLLFVIHGEVEFISVDAKPLDPGSPTRCLHLDGTFQPLPRQKGEAERLRHFQLSETVQRQCLEVARLIGSRFHSVRVDLLVGDDGRIYLNEITLSSNSGLPFKNRELDRDLGSVWEGADLFAL